jgi:ferritin
MAKFVLDRGGVPVLTPLTLSPQNMSREGCLREDLEHEREVSAAIDKLADVADEEHDRAAANFIAKYVDEQVEEEKAFATSSMCSVIVRPGPCHD